MISPIKIDSTYEYISFKLPNSEKKMINDQIKNQYPRGKLNDLYIEYCQNEKAHVIIAILVCLVKCSS